ncbi:MAG: hypothetical protein OQK78_04080 [Gammaproteobacteria bacterium]|nr:hypothetical protein [Gammaproteobacteria bacterium]
MKIKVTRKSEQVQSRLLISFLAITAVITIVVALIPKFSTPPPVVTKIESEKVTTPQLPQSPISAEERKKLKRKMESADQLIVHVDKMIEEHQLERRTKEPALIQKKQINRLLQIESQVKNLPANK